MSLRIVQDPKGTAITYGVVNTTISRGGVGGSAQLAWLAERWRGELPYP